ncbi:ras-domain-containing protein [Trichocladium antarcticum]|uniref:Ras-domain-containing protein n=1 Tax=Trichocladium antarcticum TaxID=1450529 RepID=A0AAN6UF35_9PEZI|nr:ras-domain-containing protein [Trichocladium antarcticum]
MKSPHTPSASDAAQTPVPIAITICGDGGCGKSSITLRLVRSQWTSEYDPTIEDSYSITRRIDGTTYILSLTDTAGQEEYRGMWASSNLGADAFLLVYDITAPDSLDALHYFNDLIDMEAETRLDNAARARKAGLTNPPFSAALPDSATLARRLMAHSNNSTSHHHHHHSSSISTAPSAKTIPPVKIVAGNKCDLSDARRIPAAAGLAWARQRGCGFMETSARLEVNIEETFALIVRRVAEARRMAALGFTDVGSGANSRGMTKPLTPLPGPPGDDEKGDEGGGGGLRGVGMRGPNIKGDRIGRGGGGFWRRLRCW